MFVSIYMIYYLKYLYIYKFQKINICFTMISFNIYIYIWYNLPKNILNINLYK